MEEFLKSLQSPSWWLGTIVVGILVNIVSPVISRSLEKVSNSWADNRRKQREKRDKNHHAIAVIIRKSQSHMLLVVSDEQRERSNAIFWAVFSCFCMAVSLYLLRTNVVLPGNAPRYATALGAWVFSALSGLCASFSIRALGKAAISQSILRQSWEGTNVEKEMKAHTETEVPTAADSQARP